MLDLKRAGFVSSKRGKEGGYQLDKLPEKLTLATILRQIDGPVAPLPQPTPRQFASLAEQAAALNDAQATWVTGLSQVEQDALQAYKTAPVVMNGILRGTLGVGSYREEELRTGIAANVALETALRRLATPFDMRIFRGVRGDFGRGLAQLDVGSDIFDNGFGSASIDQDYATRWARNGVVLEILVPEGMVGYAYVRDVPDTSHPLQYEVLIAPRYRLRIIAREANLIRCVMLP